MTLDRRGGVKVSDASDTDDDRCFDRWALDKVDEANRAAVVASENEVKVPRVVKAGDWAKLGKV
jgi:hypothetical protein